MKLFKKMLFLVLSIFLVFLLFFSYFGFVPGLSTLMGSNKPRDLESPHTQKDLTSALEKLGKSVLENANKDSINNTHDLEVYTIESVTFTAAELASVLEVSQPVDAVQVRLVGETFEVSGKFNKNKLVPFLSNVFPSIPAQNLKILDMLLVYDPVFYLKGTASAENNRFVFALERMEIGRLPVPIDIASAALDDYIELLVAKNPTLIVRELQFNRAELTVSAEFRPDKIDLLNSRP